LEVLRIFGEYNSISTQSFLIQSIFSISEECFFLQSLNISRCPNLTDDIKCLSKVTSLKNLDCSKNNLYIVTWLKDLTNLESLTLRNCKYLTDDSFENVASNLRKLYNLDLTGNNRLTDKTLLDFLKYLKGSLEFLCVSGCSFSSQSISKLFGYKKMKHVVCDRENVDMLKFDNSLC